MYTAQKIVVMAHGVCKPWQEVPLEDYTVKSLYEHFRWIWVKLEDVAQQVGWLDMDLVRAVAQNQSVLLQEWLVSLGAQALPTQTQPASFDYGRVHYNNAAHSGYGFEASTPTYGRGEHLSDAVKSSINLTRPGVDYHTFRNRVLTSVNGFLHMTDTDGVNGVLVLNGHDTVLRSKMSEIGLYSFAGVAPLDLIPIAEDKIEPLGTSPLSDQLLINCGQDISNKSVILSVMGYMFLADTHVFSKQSSQRLLVDVSKLNLLDRYYEAKHYINTSSLALTPYGNELVDTGEFFSDANIRKIFSLSQSFVCLVDAQLYTNYAALTKYTQAQLYSVTEHHNLPLIAGQGRLLEYSYKREDGRWALFTPEHPYRRMMYRTAGLAGSASGATLPVDPMSYKTAYLMEIAKGYAQVDQL